MLGRLTTKPTTENKKKQYTISSSALSIVYSELQEFWSHGFVTEQEKNSVGEQANQICPSRQRNLTAFKGIFKPIIHLLWFKLMDQMENLVHFTHRKIEMNKNASPQALSE